MAQPDAGARKENKCKSSSFSRKVTLIKLDDECTSFSEMRNLSDKSVIELSTRMTQDSIKDKILETFPYLEEKSFRCAALKKVDNDRKEFDSGGSRIWDGKTIRAKINKNSNLYILEQSREDRSSSDDDSPVLTSGISESEQESLENVEDTSINPESGNLEGGYPFYIEFRNELSDNVSSGRVEFFGVANVEAHRIMHSSTLTGIVPSRLLPGPVKVTAWTNAGDFLGETHFTYHAKTPPKEVKELVYDPNQLYPLFSSFSQQFGFSVENDCGIGDSYSSVNLQDAGSYVQLKKQQSMKFLELLLYTAAEEDAQRFVEMLFSTSAGPIVFNSYKSRRPLPEDVAQANGNDELAQYLRDMNTRLSEERPGETESNAINWLELAKAVQQEAAIPSDLPQDQSRGLLRNRTDNDSEDNSSNNFADSSSSASSDSEDKVGDGDTSTAVSDNSPLSVFALKTSYSKKDRKLTFEAIDDGPTVMPERIAMNSEAQMHKEKDVLYPPKPDDREDAFVVKRDSILKLSSEYQRITTEGDGNDDVPSFTNAGNLNAVHVERERELQDHGKCHIFAVSSKESSEAAVTSSGEEMPRFLASPKEDIKSVLRDDSKVASMAQSHAFMGSVQQTLQQNVDEPVPLKRKKKDSGTPFGKNVVVLKSCNVTIRNNFVFMPNTIEMAQLKKKEKGQFVTNVQISTKMTQQDIRELLISLFPYLGDQRFYCASAVDNRTRLHFHGERRIWDGRLIKQIAKGNSPLYIYIDEESFGKQDFRSSKQSMLKPPHDQMTPTMQSGCRIDKDDVSIMTQGGILVQSGMIQNIVSTTFQSQSRKPAMHIADVQSEGRNTIPSKSSLRPHTGVYGNVSSSLTHQLNSLTIASAVSEHERCQLWQTAASGHDLAHVSSEATIRQGQGNGAATMVQGIACNSADQSKRCYVMSAEVQCAGKSGSVSNATDAHQEHAGTSASDFEPQSSDSTVERLSDSGIEGSDNLSFNDRSSESSLYSVFSGVLDVTESEMDLSLDVYSPTSSQVASMAQSLLVMGSVQQTLQQNVVEPVPLKRKKKDSGTPVGKNVVVLKSCNVTLRNNFVFMPNTIEMAQLKKKEKGQFLTNVQISSKMSQKDIRELLISLFPYLGDQRFYCASAVDNRTRLDFHGERRIWDGRLIKQLARGNSPLYIYIDEESLGRQDSTSSKQSMMKPPHDQMTPTMQSGYRIDKDDVSVVTQRGILVQSGMTQNIVSTASQSQSRKPAMHIADGQSEGRNTIPSKSSLLPHTDVDVVKDICPSSSSLKGKIGFYITLTQGLPDEVKGGVARFEGVAVVVVQKLNPFLLRGTVPPSQVAGDVIVTVETEFGKQLGFTVFTYVDEMTEIHQIVNDSVLQSSFFVDARRLSRDNDIMQALDPLDLSDQACTSEEGPRGMDTSCDATRPVWL